VGFSLSGIRESQLAKYPHYTHNQSGFSMSVTSEEGLFEPLKSYLAKVPAISDISNGFSGDGYWWVKFTIDIKHPPAWRVVQELGHVLNYVSLEERLPTVFMPVSPPPYMNGGPGDFLSWVIESKSKDFKPEKCAEWLEGRLPQLETSSKRSASSVIAVLEQLVTFTFTFNRIPALMR